MLFVMKKIILQFICERNSTDKKFQDVYKTRPKKKKNSTKIHHELLTVSPEPI